MRDERREHKKATEPQPDADQHLQARRQFLIGLGKWSRAVVGGAILAAGLLIPEKPATAGWINRRGGWINGRGGWGGGSWVNGGAGGWINNRGGGSWINNRGGGGWINARY
jgi:hypothetical protein